MSIRKSDEIFCVAELRSSLFATERDAAAVAQSTRLRLAEERLSDAVGKESVSHDRMLEAERSRAKLENKLRRVEKDLAAASIATTPQRLLG